MPAPHRPERPWEPEALRLPLEAPQRRTRRPTYPTHEDSGAVRNDIDLEPDEPDHDEVGDARVERGDRPGSHVIVIDIG
jgi:hypothetical protein